MLTPDPTALKEGRTMRLSPASLRPCGNILMRASVFMARRKGFPTFARADGCLLKAGTLRLSLTFNPAHAQQKSPVAICRQAVTVLVLTRGDWQRAFCHHSCQRECQCCGEVVANFLLSPDAQLRKADPAAGAILLFSIRKNCLTGSAKHAIENAAGPAAGTG